MTPNPDPSGSSLELWRGGLWYRLERRFGVLRGSRRDLRREVAVLAAVAWLPQLVLAVVDVELGTARWSLALLAPENALRWLVAVPLLLLGMRAVSMEIDATLGELMAEEVVAADDRPRLERTCRRLVWLRDWWVTDIVLLAAAWLLGLVFVADDQGLAGQWRHQVALPLVRFLVLRWLWRWVLWGAVLWRLSRTRLTLRLSHPDRTAGLRSLVRPSRVSGLVVLGLSVLVATGWGRQMLVEGRPLATLVDDATVYVALVVCVVLAPLLVVAPLLGWAIAREIHAHQAVGHRFARAWEARWLDGRQPADPSTPDFSSLVDLGGAFERIEATRLVPFGGRDVLILVAAALLPLLPLALLEVGLPQLLRQLFALFV